jgi:hypothetical protein
MSYDQISALRVSRICIIYSAPTIIGREAFELRESEESASRKCILEYSPIEPD